MNWFELIGFLGTVFVLVSFLMKDIKRVRFINIVGAALFVVYGILINAMSTWILNASLVIINVIYLIKDRNGINKDVNNFVGESEKK